MLSVPKYLTRLEHFWGLLLEEGLLVACSNMEKLLILIVEKVIGRSVIHVIGRIYPFAPAQPMMCNWPARVKSYPHSPFGLAKSTGLPTGGGQPSIVDLNIEKHVINRNKQTQKIIWLCCTHS